jgi:hypothetical protein
MGRQALYNVLRSEGGLMALLETIKKAGLGAVEAASPVNVLFGTVISAEPLKVNVDQRFMLTDKNLVIAEHLWTYNVEMHVKNADVSTSEPNAYKASMDSADVTIQRNLKAGDKVILLRVQGGQQYVILDKVI